MGNICDEDIVLLKGIQAGSHEAFNTLFKRYYLALCTFGSRFIRLEDAEEIAQDVMLWIWENHSQLNIEHSLKQYLFRSVYHRAMNRITQLEAKQRIDTTFYERFVDTIQDIDISHINEMSRHINQAINELPESYREAFIMNRFQDLSYKEIAEKLNVSPKTIDYRIQQALKILRIKLRDYLPIVFLGLYM